MTDELRERLRRADPAAVPAPAAPPADPTSRPAPELLERIMTTPVPTRQSAPTPPGDPRHPAARRVRRLTAAAASAVVLAGVGYAATRAGDAPADTSATAPAPDPATVELSLPDGNAIASCAVFDVAFLRDMSPAFAGTVTTADAERVVLDVDRWYAGGEAERVELAVPDGTTSAALDGVSFVEGQRFFVTAAGGTVNGCGYSGPATPELAAAFEEAFG